MIANLKNEKIHRILLIRLRKIGDVLLLVPTIKAFRQKFPAAYIAALVNAGTEPVLSGSPYLNEILIFDPKWKDLPIYQKIKKECKFVRQIRQRRFDLAINFTEGDRGAFLCLASGARLKVGVWRRDRTLWWKKLIFDYLIDVHAVKGHVVEQLLEIPRRMGIETSDKKLEIFFSPEDEEEVNRLLQEEGLSRRTVLIHMHPTSHWLFKCWRNDRVAKVIDGLQAQKEIRVVLTSGPDEREMRAVKDILNLCHSQPINLAGRLNLKQLAALSKSSQLFIGVDTAPMHIAAAVGTPIIALFGPSGEVSWGPWGDGHMVIKKNFPCRPCGRDGCGGSKRSRCLEEITAEEVLEIAWSMLAKRNTKVH